ncbi:MAG: 1-acyl-sn-glycerol-3-phosphate acyltransferase [Methylophilaceae bacterium]|nr:1-acyl-sn-glycerol-3-phosphate acyltransferase [Methylophilaceae bacterium]
MIVRLWRLARLGLHFGYGVVAACVLPWLGQRQRRSLVQSWSAHILHILNVRLQVEGMLPTASHPPALFVANHISWLDIWAINAVHPMRFVAKSEVRAWPIIGWLSEKVGVIFIERGRRHDTARVSGVGAEALRQGHSVCVFAEGTTSDGTHLYPFKSSLLQSAVDAGALVWPIALQYRDTHGRLNTAVAYTGDVTMFQSLCAVLAQREIVVRLIFAEPMPAVQRDRRTLTRAAESAIAALAHLPVRATPETTVDPPA